MNLASMDDYERQYLREIIAEEIHETVPEMIREALQAKEEEIMSRASERFTRERNLAIALLDDDKGISEEAYEQLCAKLAGTPNIDILMYVDATDGRFYLKENDAKFLQEKS